MCTCHHRRRFIHLPSAILIKLQCAGFDQDVFRAVPRIIADEQTRQDQSDALERHDDRAERSRWADAFEEEIARGAKAANSMTHCTRLPG